MERQDKDDRGHTSFPNDNVQSDNVPNDNVDVPNDVYTGALGDSICNAAREDGDRENQSETGKKEGILELVYGVLFEPVRTFAGLTRQPPVLTAVVIVVLLNLAEALMGLFTTPQYMRGLQLPNLPELDILRSIIPLAAVGGFFFGFVKWFFMAGLLHLLAVFYGGRGDARSVFTVYGLAGLPAALMIPVQLLAVYFESSAAFNIITGILSLAVFIWSVVLLIIGIREVHWISSGKAALTVFTPILTFIILFIIGLIMLGSVMSTIPELQF
ncbi:MAG: Yip1 family protein [Desulfotomaculaceae bacterium]